MPDFPAGGAFGSGMGVPALTGMRSPYVSNTPSSTANTKGTWAEAIASTSFDANYVIVGVLQNLQAQLHDWLMDVGIGANGAEKVIISNLLVAGFGQAGTNYRSAFYFFPMHIPKGSRIAFRSQSSGGAQQIYGHIWLVPYGFLGTEPGGVVETWGAATADSGGTQVDPGAVAGTKGAWVPLTTSTSFHVSSINVAFGNQRQGTRTFTDWDGVDIGIGASGQEKVLVSDLSLRAWVGADTVDPTTYGPIPVQIPKGSRISARAACGITDATDRLFDIIVYGV